MLSQNVKQVNNLLFFDIYVKQTKHHSICTRPHTISSYIGLFPWKYAMCARNCGKSAPKLRIVTPLPLEMPNSIIKMRTWRHSHMHVSIWCMCDKLTSSCVAMEFQSCDVMLLRVRVSNIVCIHHISFICLVAHHARDYILIIRGILWRLHWLHASLHARDAFFPRLFF